MEKRCITSVVLAAVFFMAAPSSAGIELITESSGGAISAGSVQVFVNGDVLSLAFTTSGEWLVTKAHLEFFVDDAGLTDIPVTNKGKPQPGKFEWVQNDLGYVQSFGDTFSLSALGFGPGKRVCIALHVLAVQVNEKGKVVLQEDLWAMDSSDPKVFPDGVSMYFVCRIPKLPDTLLAQPVSLDISSDPRLEGVVRFNPGQNMTVSLSKVAEGKYVGWASFMIKTFLKDGVSLRFADVSLQGVFVSNGAANGTFSVLVSPIVLMNPGGTITLKVEVNGAVPGAGFTPADPLLVGSVILKVTTLYYEEIPL